MPSMTRYLVTGAAGQLGYGLWQRFKETEQDMCKSHESYDITDMAQVSKWTPTLRPDAIINCAGYTQTIDSDRPHNPKLCWLVNSVAAANLARVAAENNYPFIQLSSNLVFGQYEGKTDPYLETDPVSPVGCYGQTKAAIEHYILQLAHEYPQWQYFIIRTAGLFEFPWRPASNYPNKVLQLLRSQHTTRVPSTDSIYSNITYVPHLVDAVAWFVNNRFNIPRGIYHITNEGACTPYQVASIIAREDRRGAKLCTVSRQQYAESNQFSLDQLPRNTALSTNKYKLLGGPEMPTWFTAISTWAALATQKPAKVKGQLLSADA